MNDPWKYGTSRRFRRALRDASMVKLCEKLHRSEMIFGTCLTGFNNCPFFLRERVSCLAPNSAEPTPPKGYMRDAHGVLRGCYLWLFNQRGEEAVRRLEAWQRRAKHSGTR